MAKRYVIIGSTHTGISLVKKLCENDQAFLFDTKDCPDRTIRDRYRKVETIDDAIQEEADFYFVTFDDDSANVRACLAINAQHPDAQIYTMISQDSLGNKVSMCIPNLHYINPSKHAATEFVTVALNNLTPAHEEKFKWPRIMFRMDSLVKMALVFIFTVMSTSVAFFHFYDDLPWVDSMYFTVTMMATVGFGPLGPVEDIRDDNNGNERDRYRDNIRPRVRLHSKETQGTIDGAV